MSALPTPQGTPTDAPVVGIDLGGTKIRSVVTRADGTILGEDIRPTDAEGGPSVVVDRLVASAHAAVAASGVPHASILAVGVTAPGTVDFDEGVLHQPPNLPGWD